MTINHNINIRHDYNLEINNFLLFIKHTKKNATWIFYGSKVTHGLQCDYMTPAQVFAEQNNHQTFHFSLI